MRRSILKLISVACALIMVMTVFQVMTNGVSAEVGDDVLALTDPAEHDHRRLTISNDGATSPSSTISSNGTLHLAWANLVDGGMELDYKISFDNGASFSSDRAISPVFYSISNISIVSSDLDVSIAFEGRLTESANQTIYVQHSSDGGITWSRTFQLCDGSSPSVALTDGRLYLGLMRPNGNSSVFSILNITLDGNELVGATPMAALEIGDGFGRIVADASALYYAVHCSFPYDAIVYGSIGYDGAQVDATTLIASFSTGVVADLDLVLNNGIVFIGWSYNGVAGAIVQGAISSSDHLSWSSVAVSHASGIYGQVSATAHGDGFFVAWENATKAWTEISASAISSCGSILIDAERLSTDRIESSFPSVIASLNGDVPASGWRHTTTRPSCSTSRTCCTNRWTFMISRATSPHWTMACSVDLASRAMLLASIDTIVDDLVNFREEAALNEVYSLMAAVDGFVGGSIGDDIMLSFAAQEKIYDMPGLPGAGFALFYNPECPLIFVH